MLVVDKFSTGRRKSNIRETAIDLEEGLTGIKDASVDLFVTASSLEHLTANGQRRVFADVERALKPGGVFCGTVSYITRLDSRAIQLIQSDPVFEQIGSMVHARFDLRACLQSAARLQPLFPPPDWSAFPGFDGFDESRLLDSAAFISGQVGSYGQVRCLPEVDALQLKWFEIALFLRKSV